MLSEASSNEMNAQERGSPDSSICRTMSGTSDGVSPTSLRPLRTTQVTHVSAGIERYGDQRIGVQVVAGTHAAIEVRRRIADDKIDSIAGC
jgi:hypothetical protein